MGKIKADPGQLEQVLMNLVVNSRDAMPKGGRLTIETSNVTLDESYANDHISVTAGSYLMLVVSDTGCGMDLATRTRIFEPFFTTKELGGGTGLGLSIVYGIVKQSEGNIWVYSEPAKGRLSKSICAAEEQGTRLEAPATADRIPGGSETILVVEDDEVVRQLVTRILQSGGYRMLEASDGSNALQICQQCEGQIELVLTDLVMPQMSGPALTEKLQELYPGIRIVYTSGYADDAIVRHGHLDPGMPFIKSLQSKDNLLRRVPGSAGCRTKRALADQKSELRDSAAFCLSSTNPAL